MMLGTVSYTHLDVYKRQADGHANAAGEYQRSGVSFALLGDVPYGLSEEPKFDKVIDDINASRNRSASSVRRTIAGIVDKPTS